MYRRCNQPYWLLAEASVLLIIETTAKRYAMHDHCSHERLTLDCALATLCPNEGGVNSF